MVHTCEMKAATNIFIIGDFPQLRLIAWNRNPYDAITGREAFDLYERSGRFIDEVAMLPHERAWVDQLVHECGHGILHV